MEVNLVEKINIYEIRKKGIELCKTNGTEHYHNQIEPIELIFALGYGEGFCMGNAIKYSARYKNTQNLKDLKKIADYAHMLAGFIHNKDNEQLDSKS